jgi:hypothetical protein
MTMHFGLIGVVITALATAAPGIPSSQVFAPAQDIAALHAWTLNIEAYMALREQAAQVAPPPRFPLSAADLLRAELAFAAEIRTRRHDAQMGDLFTAEVQRTFRKLIARTIGEHEMAMADFLNEFLAVVIPGGSRPAVNQRFPWQLGSAMPGCLLEVLPALPQGLQYRLVGRDLILLDLDANLVVDILPEALPRPALDPAARTTSK